MAEELLICKNGENITVSQCKCEIYVIDGHNLCDFCDNIIAKTIYDRRTTHRNSVNLITYLSEYPSKGHRLNECLGTTIDISKKGLKVDLVEGFDKFHVGDKINIDLFCFMKISLVGEVVYMISNKDSNDSGVLGIKIHHFDSKEALTKNG
jgi:hypothetical protein